ncbi:type II toxin-antitoxin system CcdA family antitoxin [Roseovarius sp. M141]|uniref:type II toxin-antitoxin system CcdA family antitoxin n=1 Tax=Roseovarius sp. M141 TaxID=2583806 RepID=UPI0020CCB20A
MAQANQTPRKSTSMTLDGAILEEARALGINVSRAAESGVISAIRAERAKLWKQQNAGAIAEYNAYIDAGGVPLATHRKF